MNNSLGTLAFVSIIALAAVAAYKIKDVDLKSLGSSVDKVNSILNPSGTVPASKPFDFITIGAGLLIVAGLVQVVRLKRA